MGKRVTRSDEIESHNIIIGIIAGEQEERMDWNASHREAMKKNVTLQNTILKSKNRAAWTKDSKEVFKTLIKRYSKSYYYNKTGERFTPFDKRLEFNSSEHPIRQIQERYLMIQLGIEHSASSDENWAAIGMKLASKEINLLDILNSTEGKERRGRPRGGAHLDYERAVWKYSLDNYILEHVDELIKKHSKIPRIPLSKLLDAYLYALENPSSHNYGYIFEHLEDRLKIRAKSRASLLVSFNRGEKKREDMWDD